MGTGCVGLKVFARKCCSSFDCSGLRLLKSAARRHLHSRNHIRSTQYWMAKRKQPEEDSKDSDFYKDTSVSTTQVVANAGCSKYSTNVKLAEGGTSRKESNEEGAGSSVPVVTTETRKEDGWEAEAFWKLLADVGYTTW